MLAIEDATAPTNNHTNEPPTLEGEKCGELGGKRMPAGVLGSLSGDGGGDVVAVEGGSKKGKGAGRVFLFIPGQQVRGGCHQVLGGWGWGDRFRRSGNRLTMKV